MVKAHLLQQMVISMWASGRMTIKMVVAHLLLQMAIGI